MKEHHIFSPDDFSSAIGEPLSERVKSKIEELNIEYARMTPQERDECIKTSVKILLDPEFDASGAHRLGKWEKGWSENLQAFRERGKGGLVPGYFSATRDLVKWGKWKQEYIRPLQGNLDYKFLSIILEWLFEKYIPAASSVYEFGCGTGHHLLKVREFNPEAKIYGLDWAEASQEIIKEMVAKDVAKNTYGKKFDFFNPDESFALDANSVVYTVGALEQVGEKHEKFIAYLLKNRPKICFHVEPIGELLDDSNRTDFLTQSYYRKRNYLSNFVNHLKALEKEGKIKIEKAQRTYLGGSLLTEYAVVMWSPVA
ncbi:MAG: hypothetical protein HYU81_02235 [Candidatus Brennerbacteria bacterium]|nr:hypothetical protein [Candidatus Brennerbacteria bacterium]